MSTRVLGGLVLLLAVLAGACAEVNVHPGYQLAVASGQGVLAMGITADDGMENNFHWRLRRAGTHENRDITFYTLRDPLIWQHPRGRMVFIELPDGEYEFFDWGGGSSRAMASSYFSIPFSIHAGRVTYLGHVDLVKVAGSPSYKVSSENRYADDRPLLAAQIANLSDDLTDQAVAVLQPCAEGECRKPQIVMINGRQWMIIYGRVR